MKINTAPSATTVIPRVWIGCLHCYNDGRLIGVWYDCSDLADDPEEFGLARIHRDGGYAVQPGCEELWRFDHEELPVKGGCPYVVVKGQAMYSPKGFGGSALLIAGHG